VITTLSSLISGVVSPGLTSETPATPIACVATASASAGLVMITTGETTPAGNDAEIVFNPSTDSASVRKVSA
jgi:hypothetical protein